MLTTHPYISVAQSMSLARRITHFHAYFFPNRGCLCFFVQINDRLQKLRRIRLTCPRPMWMLSTGGAAWRVAVKYQFLMQLWLSKSAFQKSNVHCKICVCMNLFALDVIISNELLKKLFQERWTLCFSGLSYFKFCRVLSRFQTGLQLQHVRIWSLGMERYSPSRTLLHTPSRPAAPPYSPETPSQVRTICRKYDRSLLFSGEAF